MFSVCFIRACFGGCKLELFLLDDTHILLIQSCYGV